MKVVCRCFNSSRSRGFDHVAVPLVWTWACLQLSLLCPQSTHSHNPSSHQSHNTHMIVTSSSSSSSTTPHRVVGQQGYDGMMNKGGQYQPGMPLSVVPSGGPGQYQGNMPQGKQQYIPKGFSWRLLCFGLSAFEITLIVCVWFICLIFNLTAVA